MNKADQTHGTALRLALVHLRPTLESTRAFVRNAPPLALAAVVAVVGDATGRCGYDLDPSAFILAASVAFLILRRRGCASGRVAAAAVVLLWANQSAYRVRHPALPNDHVARSAARGPRTVEGVLRNDVPVSPSRVRLLLDVDQLLQGKEWQGARGRIQITIQSTAQAWHSGDRVRATLRLRRPRNFGNPNELDYEGYLASRGVYATAYLSGDGDLVRLGHDPNPWSGWLDRWRRGVGEVIANTLPPPQSTVLAALIVGTDVPLTRDLRDSFSRAGVSHVLSISGLHIGLVATAAYAALRWLLARSEWLLLSTNVPKLAVAASVVPVLLYAGIAGDDVATRRSVIMILVFLGAVLVDRRRDLFVSLAAAALAVLLTTPGSSLDISFQLSFVAVIGLALGVECFWPWWQATEELHLLRLRGSWRRSLWRAVALYAAVSASALAATTPLTAFHFNQVSLVAPLANAVVVPLLGSIAVVVGLLAAVVLPLSDTAASFLIMLAGPVVKAGIVLTQLCAALPFASLRVVTPSVVELGLLYLSLLAWLQLRGSARTCAMALLALAASVDSAWWFSQRYLHADLRTTFLSVGQGDCSIVELPGGEVMVVDAGGSFGDELDMGERVVAPFLWSRKIARVDYLVLSHPDRDHYGGLAFLARHFAAREFWTTGAAATGDSFAALLRAVDESGTRVVTLRTGDRRELAGGGVQILSPSKLSDGNDNDNSLVLRLDFAGQHLLFTGDIQRLAEERLVQQDRGGLSSAVLKVPHHGSRTSSALPFISSVRPTLAVISVGFGNRFHFPSEEVMRRYDAIDSTVLRTDIDGAVGVSIHPTGEITATRHLAGLDD